MEEDLAAKWSDNWGNDKTALQNAVDKSIVNGYDRESLLKLVTMDFFDE